MYSSALDNIAAPDQVRWGYDRWYIVLMDRIECEREKGSGCEEGKEEFFGVWMFC